MEVLYISSACSEHFLKTLSKKYMSGKPLKAPQQTFDLSVALGLSKHVNLNLISLPPIPSYPKSKCVYFPKKKEKVNKKIAIEYIPVINFPLIKSFCILLFLLCKIFVWSRKNKSKKKYILLHWPFYPTMLAAFLSRYLTNSKVILIVPDIPDLALTYNKRKKIIVQIKKIISRFKPNLINQFDGYVLLTKYMREKLNIMNKPYTIMEGLIRDEDILKNNTIENKYPKKVVMYAGAVYKKFGLKNLVEAFHRYVNIECELWIFGEGDFVEEVKRYEAVNEKIKYKGLKFRDEILDAEKKATLLINPRPTNEEFTKYSFPSKTLEYLGSGTPLLSTKLKGIPDEYFEYVLCIEKETAEAIGEQINNLLRKGEQWLHNKGKIGQEWVKHNKNAEKQTQKIINLLKTIN